MELKFKLAQPYQPETDRRREKLSTITDLSRNSEQFTTKGELIWTTLTLYHLPNEDKYR